MFRDLRFPRPPLGRADHLAPRHHRLSRLVLLGVLLSALLVQPTAAAGSAWLVQDLNPGAAGGLTPDTPLVAFNGLVYFGADDGTGPGLWRSDGTATGTTRVRAFSSYPPTNLSLINGRLYFSADDGVNGNELWTSDGTPSGTLLVKDINPGPAGSGPQRFVLRNGTLFFAAYTTDLGFELWQTDGTAAGTVVVQDIYPGANGSIPSALTVVNDTLLFNADDGVHGRELWRSDGTAGGTVLVRDIAPGPTGSLNNDDPVVALNGALFYRADDGVHGQELWRSDGTAAGTVLVKDIYWGARGGLGISQPYLTPFNGALYFAAASRSTGLELWQSDGTAAGTTLVKDIEPYPTFGSQPVRLTNVAGTLFFGASDLSHGMELWKSDGTSDGTVLVKDIDPGVDSSFPEELTAVNNTLVFAANDGASGYEPWRSDGTATGTFQVQDIAPGDAFSGPQHFTLVGPTVFFVADDGTHGYELWAMPASLTPPPVLVEPPALTFGPQDVGSSSYVQISTLTNTQAVPLTITSARLTGATPLDFAVTQGCGASVPPGGSCPFFVSFSPRRSGARSATLAITTSAGSYSIALNGTATTGPANYVPNPGFEVDANGDGKPDGWFLPPEAPRTFGEVHSGNYALQLQSATDADLTIGRRVYGVLGGIATWDISAWLNIPATSDTFTVDVFVQWRDAQDRVVRTDLIHRSTAPTAGWAWVGKTLFAPAGARTALLGVRATSLKGPVYLDDFGFYPYSEPGAAQPERTP